MQRNGAVFGSLLVGVSCVLTALIPSPTSRSLAASGGYPRVSLVLLTSTRQRRRRLGDAGWTTLAGCHASRVPQMRLSTQAHTLLPSISQRLPQRSDTRACPGAYPGECSGQLFTERIPPLPRLPEK